MKIKIKIFNFSATIGQPEQFFRWLTDLERSKSRSSGFKRNVRLIYYKESHNDVKRFLFTNNDMKKINPLGCLCYSNLIKHKVLPSDINLLPSEILELYDELKKNNIHEIDSLNPDSNNILKTDLNFSLFLTRNSVKEFGKILKEKLIEYVLENKEKHFFENLF